MPVKAASPALDRCAIEEALIIGGDEILVEFYGCR